MKYQVEYRYSRNHGEWLKYTEVFDKEHATSIAKNDVPLGAEEVRVLESVVVWEGFPK